MENKIAKEELVQLIKENFMDENGHVNISDLDFGDCERINISRMKLKGDIKQYEHQNNGDIWQFKHQNNGDIWEGQHKNKEKIITECEPWKLNKITKQQLVQLIKDNFTDQHGNVKITNLDFGDCPYVDISGMKLKGNVKQCNHRNKGYVWQDKHQNNGDVWQYMHKNKGNVLQFEHKNDGDVHQIRHENNGHVFQHEHKNKGDVIQTDIEGKRVDIERVKILTHKELKEIVGYEFEYIKGDE